MRYQHLALRYLFGGLGSNSAASMAVRSEVLVGIFLVLKVFEFFVAQLLDFGRQGSLAVSYSSWVVCSNQEAG